MAIPSAKLKTCKLFAATFRNSSLDSIRPDQWPEDPRLKKINIEFFSIAIELERNQFRDWSFSIFKIGYVNQSRSISETNLDQYFLKVYFNTYDDCFWATYRLEKLCVRGCLVVCKVAWKKAPNMSKGGARRGVVEAVDMDQLSEIFHDLVNKHGADAFKLGPYDRMKSTQACSAEGLHCNAEISKRLVVFFLRSLTESRAPFF